MSVEADRRIALTALRNRVANLADTILRTDTARRELAVAFKAASDAGASQADIDVQVRIACQDKPERAVALEHAGLLGEPADA